MIEGRSVLGVIPARGGSKGVSRKNLREVGGKPLIAWTIEQGLASRYLDRLILSSEDQEIMQVAKLWGCDVPFTRPVELSQDDTPGIDPILHAIDVLPGYDCVVLLQPTSPLRTVADIDSCIERCVRGDVPACVSVTESDKSPYWMYTLNTKNELIPLLETDVNITRRQNLPEVVALNGSVYVAKCDWLRDTRQFVTSQTIGYSMPKARSLDIDTELDLILCEALITQEEG